MMLSELTTFTEFVCHTCTNVCKFDLFQKGISSIFKDLLSYLLFLTYVENIGS